MSRLSGIAACIAVAALAGCGSREAELEGAATPPADFGEIDAPLFGCAPVSGLYAWPPVAGEGDDGQTPRRAGAPLPVLMPTDLALFREAQIWVDERRGLRLNSRMVNRSASLGIGALTTQWSFHELSEVACEDGRWTWSAPPADEGSLRAGIDQARLADSGADSISGGLLLQRMANGRLAVGQWQRLRFRAGGRRGPPEAGESRLDPPDRIVWHWSLLERLGDTGEGAPPADAAINPDASPATR